MATYFLPPGTRLYEGGLLNDNSGTLMGVLNADTTGTTLNNGKVQGLTNLGAHAFSTYPIVLGTDTGTTAAGTIQFSATTTATNVNGAMLVGSSAPWTKGTVNGIIGFPGASVQHGQIAWFPGVGMYFLDSSAKDPGGAYPTTGPKLTLVAGAMSLDGAIDVSGSTIVLGGTTGSKAWIDTSGNASFSGLLKADGGLSVQSGQSATFNGSATFAGSSSFSGSSNFTGEMQTASVYSNLGSLGQTGTIYNGQIANSYTPVDLYPVGDSVFGTVGAGNSGFGYSYGTVRTSRGYGDNQNGFPYQMVFREGSGGNIQIRNALSTSKPTWAASTAYVVGDYVMPTQSAMNGWYFECTTAGTSGTTQPTWPDTSGATVGDGTVVWTASGQFWAAWADVARTDLGYTWQQGQTFSGLGTFGAGITGTGSVGTLTVPWGNLTGTTGAVTQPMLDLSTWGVVPRIQGVLVFPEGSVTDDGAGHLTFGSVAIVMNPASGSWTRIAAGTYTLGGYGFLYIDVPPTGAERSVLTPSVGAWVDGDVSYPGKDRWIIAQRQSTGRIYMNCAVPAMLTGTSLNVVGSLTSTNGLTATNPTGVGAASYSLVLNGGSLSLGASGLELNLGNANVWTASQTFNFAVQMNGPLTAYGNAQSSAYTQLGVSGLGNGAWVVNMHDNGATYGTIYGEQNNVGYLGLINTGSSSYNGLAANSGTFSAIVGMGGYLATTTGTQFTLSSSGSFSATARNVLDDGSGGMTVAGLLTASGGVAVPAGHSATINGAATFGGTTTFNGKVEFLAAFSENQVHGQVPFAVSGANQFTFPPHLTTATITIAGAGGGGGGGGGGYNSGGTGVAYGGQGGGAGGEGSVVRIVLQLNPGTANSGTAFFTVGSGGAAGAGCAGGSSGVNQDGLPFGGTGGGGGNTTVKYGITTWTANGGAGGDGGLRGGTTYSTPGLGAGGAGAASSSTQPFIVVPLGGGTGGAAGSPSSGTSGNVNGSGGGMSKGLPGTYELLGASGGTSGSKNGGTGKPGSYINTGTPPYVQAYQIGPAGGAGGGGGYGGAGTNFGSGGAGGAGDDGYIMISW